MFSLEVQGTGQMKVYKNKRAIKMQNWLSEQLDKFRAAQRMHGSDLLKASSGTLCKDMQLLSTHSPKLVIPLQSLARLALLQINSLLRKQQPRLAVKQARTWKLAGDAEEIDFTGVYLPQLLQIGLVRLVVPHALSSLRKVGS